MQIASCQYRTLALWFNACIVFISSTCLAQSEVKNFAGFKLNEIQLIGSHNSYKPGIEPALWSLLYKIDSSKLKALQYGHIPLTAQLDLGLRNLEIDVVHDPLGGRYSKPMGVEMLKHAGIVAEPFDTARVLMQAGLKVFHVQDIDFRSHQLLFIDCLKTLKQWSKKHPGHLPVIITINAKDGDEKGLSKMLPFTHDALDSIDLEIKNVFPEDALITPDFIRGEEESLEQTILKNGWPMLNKLADRFLFVLDETGAKLETYKKGHPSLQGKVLFVNETEGHDEASIMIINNAQKDGAKIKALVEKGYLVRTRADANTIEARNNDYSLFKAAKESGAQIITTDYYLPSTFFNSSYKVIFENGKYLRPNPVTGRPN